MTQPDRLRRFDLIIDLRSSMLEWGDTPEYVRPHQQTAESAPIEQLEKVVARWRVIIEARRVKRMSEASA